MHIPPYHKKKSWQRFFVGTFFGGVVAYCILLYMYGSMYENLLKQNFELHSQVSTLKNQNKALLKDKEDLDKQTKESETVKSIEIIIPNDEELKLDELIVYQLEQLIKEEISHLIGQDAEIVSESEQLLYSTIENKSFKVDDLTYMFTVEKLSIINETMTLTLKAEIKS